MSEPLKVGHAQFTMHRGNDHGMHLVVGGYGRDPLHVATFTSDRAAALARAALQRGMRDIAPIIWETGEQDENACRHVFASVRPRGDDQAVVCDSCEIILSRLHPRSS